MKKVMVLGMSLFVLTVSCKAQKTTDTQSNDRKQQGPPSVEEVFKMDSNSDGVLSKTEVKGPLLNDFDKIDTDGDGFLSKTEVENAPKPERGGQGRPPRK